MKLVKLVDEYFLLDVDMSRMAKELPDKTNVFCLDEVHMDNIEECLRVSSKGDNCYGCQPLLASTTKIEGAVLLDKSKIEELLSNYNQIDALAQNFIEEYFYPDIQAKGENEDADNMKNFVKNWLKNVPLEDKEKRFTISDMKQVYLNAWYDRDITLTFSKEKHDPESHADFHLSQFKMPIIWDVEIEITNSDCSKGGLKREGASCSLNDNCVFPICLQQAINILKIK